jgi:hypothetical protein
MRAKFLAITAVVASGVIATAFLGGGTRAQRVRNFPFVRVR